MLPRLWLLVGSDRPTDRQCHLLSCPGQLKKGRGEREHRAVYSFVWMKNAKSARRRKSKRSRDCIVLENSDLRGERAQKKLSCWMSLSLRRKIWSAPKERQEMGQVELLNILNIWNKGHYPMIELEWSTHGNPSSCLKNRRKMRLSDLPYEDTKTLKNHFKSIPSKVRPTNH